MKTYVAYEKISDTYEIDDDFGGTSLDIPIVKTLLKLIKKTHPELLENLK